MALICDFASIDFSGFSWDNLDKSGKPFPGVQGVPLHRGARALERMTPDGALFFYGK